MGENQYGQYDVTIPESVSNEDLQKIAWGFAREGGDLVRLPRILGLSEQRWEEYIGWLRARGQRKFADRRYPILIPKTSPTSYISFNRALNLRLPGELTGDWHFESSFFGYPEGTYSHLAGPNGLVDTTPTLGSHGVRDMGRRIAGYGIKAYDGPVWAILIMSLDSLSTDLDFDATRAVQLRHTISRPERALG